MLMTLISIITIDISTVTRWVGFEAGAEGEM